MLNYEKCKELKEAGFPDGQYQFWYVRFVYNDSTEYCSGVTVGNPYVTHHLELGHGETVLCACPALEELIEACVGQQDQDRSLYMWCNGGRWYSETRWATNRFRGDTPAEAVANLWLAVNKK